MDVNHVLKLDKVVCVRSPRFLDQIQDPQTHACGLGGGPRAEAAQLRRRLELPLDMRGMHHTRCVTHICM